MIKTDGLFLLCDLAQIVLNSSVQPRDGWTQKIQFASTNTCVFLRGSPCGVLLRDCELKIGSIETTRETCCLACVSRH